MAVKLRVLAGPAGDEPVPSEERAVQVDAHLPEIRLGRRAGLEVELPFPALSPIHARLLPRDGGWVVEDLGSERGTTVDGVALEPGVPRAIGAGAVIALGSISVVFDGVGATARPGESTATIARRLVSDLFGARTGGEIARLIPTAGWPADRPPPEPLRLAIPDRAYLIGRGEACDLVLPTDDISREHAVIVRRWTGVQIRDLGSKNGLRVGGKPIDGEHRLRDGDSVEIASFELRLDDPEDRYLRELEAPVAPTVVDESPREAAPIAMNRGSTRVTMVVAGVVLLVVVAAILVIALG
jgi:pSer/pThr/pTyr-binding forkhead associated (FHA) protein